MSFLIDAQGGINWLLVAVIAGVSLYLSAFFSDALIVWKDRAAYSANPETAAQISQTDDVSTLTSLAASDEVWVRY